MGTVLTIFAPMVYATANTQSRSDFVGVNSQEELIIHRSETLEVPITLQNIKDYTQTYTLELLSIICFLYTLHFSLNSLVLFIIFSAFEPMFFSTLGELY